MRTEEKEICISLRRLIRRSITNKKSSGYQKWASLLECSLANWYNINGAIHNYVTSLICVSHHSPIEIHSTVHPFLFNRTIRTEWRKEEEIISCTDSTLWDHIQNRWCILDRTFVLVSFLSLSFSVYSFIFIIITICTIILEHLLTV